jgi:hypothetical protein
MQMRVFYHETTAPLPILLNTVDSNYGNKGPFLIGDWIYALTRLESPLRMRMVKFPATDPGFGFLDMDTANEPNNLSTTCWTMVPFNNTLHILSIAGGNVNEMEFDTATDLWIDHGAQGSAIVTTGSAARSHGDLQVRDNGELVLSYQGESERVMGGEKERVYVMYKDGSPPTWTIDVALDVGGDIHYGNAILTKSPNTDGMHVFWQRQTATANDPPIAWADSEARTFEADNTLATLATGSQDTDDAMLGAKQGVSWDNQDDSPDDQMTIWIGARSVGATHTMVRFLGSQNNNDIITGIGSSLSGFNAPNVNASSVGVIAMDTWPDPANSPPTTEKIYVLWSGGGSGAGDGDLYFAFSDDNGATWSTPDELINNVSISELSGSIFQKPDSSVVFAFTMELLDEEYYGEHIIIAAPSAAAPDFLPYYPRRINTLLRM